MKKSTIPSGFTVAHDHSGLLGWSPASRPKAVVFGRPMPSSAWPERGQHTWHGEIAGASLEPERWQGFDPGHPHGSIYEPQHLNQEEVVENGVLTSEEVRATTTNDVEGGNEFNVREDAPSLTSELHKSVADIRQCLTKDE
jgi:hypothetical protein